VRKTNCSGSPEAFRFFSLKKLGLQGNCIDKEKPVEDQTGNYVPMNCSFVRVPPGSLLGLFLLAKSSTGNSKVS